MLIRNDILVKEIEEVIRQRAERFWRVRLFDVYRGDRFRRV